MNPIDWLTQLGTLGKLAGDVASKGLAVAAGNVFDSIMQGLWGSGLTVLQLVLEGVDAYSRFTVSKTDGPIGVVWPVMLWISGVLALGLFFWQIISAVLRGGRGFTRLLIGPMQYCVALAASVGIVAALLAAADGLTTFLLGYGLHSDRFADAMHALNLLDGVSKAVTAVILGVAAVFGTFPAGFGMAFEMILRQAGIDVIVATIPILAAGLLANTTSRWFWKGVRGVLALIFLKPAIALVIVIGVATVAGRQGLFGLLSGIVTLLFALFMPIVLFKLFSFIDPNAGSELRGEMSDLGPDTYGPDSLPGRQLGNMFDKLKKAWQDWRSGDDDGDEDDAQESANDERFDAAEPDLDFESEDDEFRDDESRDDEDERDGKDERDEEQDPDDESAEDDASPADDVLPPVVDAVEDPEEEVVPDDDPPDDDDDDDRGPAEEPVVE
ncbi:type IV secretion system protein [Amycolatopsis rubida]|uniref:Type IV secretion system protein n=1 Tax=Amycolatopsis rubida TaxID=112413 RepID=A0ABX0C4T1_9PSEU|nr:MULTISPECIES: hypothetical protein [Amycolatopsis]MYW96287.1 hypothetical protein [Amycolatopsis rubida]NEC61278.1 type IV secretion system protein [Amycolatopsis rubida]OAP24190.1 hypothetical protein A4R44_04963 [Amycolatopsis sp. M39]